MEHHEVVPAVPRRVRRRRNRRAQRSQLATHLINLTPAERLLFSQGGAYETERVYIPGDTEGHAVYKRSDSPHVPPARLLQQLEAYVANWGGLTDAPPVLAPTLIKHYASLVQAVDDILSLAILIYKQRKMEHLKTRFDLMTIRLRALTWNWHRELHDRAARAKGIRDHELAFLLSWAACMMRLYGIPRAFDREMHDRLLARPLAEFPLVKRYGPAGLIITKLDLKHMTLEKQLQSIHVFYAFTYRYSYSEDMRDFLQALLLAYSQVCTWNPQSIRFLRSRAHADKLTAEELEVETRMREESSRVQNQPAPVPIEIVDAQTNETHRLKMDSLYLEENILFSMMMRTTISMRLQELCPRRSTDLLLNSAKDYLGVITRCTIALNVDTIGLLRTVLKKTVEEEYYGRIFSVNLYHGERMRFTRKYQAGMTDDTILQTLRSSEYERVNAYHEKPVSQFMDAYLKAWMAYVDSVSDDITYDELYRQQESRRYLEFEREWVMAILLTYAQHLAGFNSTLSSLQVWEMLDELTLVEAAIEDALVKGYPLLVRHMRISYVVLPNGESFSTPFFAEAAIVWLQTLARTRWVPEKARTPRVNQIPADQTTRLMNAVVPPPATWGRGGRAANQPQH